jgi:serine protein kinase
MSEKDSKFSDLGQKVYSAEEYSRIHESLDVYGYLDKLREDARPARTAFQRVYDMVNAAGEEKFTQFKQELVRYNFFQPMMEDGSASPDTIYGLEPTLKKLVDHFKKAALRLGAEKRVLLLHGPVGSAKSTSARILKKGMEKDSLENPIYTFKWAHPGNDSRFETEQGVILEDKRCMMNEDPLRLVDPRIQAEVIKRINESNKGNDMMKYPVMVEGGLCPQCRFTYKALMDHYDGNWEKVMSHVVVERLFLSEADRVGISSFQPKDEKNQDSTELTGNINYRKIAQIGSDSDPRAFDLDGELCVANRGMVEFIEILKLETAFLYDLLGASQEHLIKPKKQALVSIDEIILSHTNEEEFRKLQSDELMKAFRDRTVRIDVPYNLNHRFETMIYVKDYTPERVQKHIAPHTLDIAALWAVLTRLEGPKEEVAGTELPGFTEETAKKLKEDGVREGLDGISPRFIQDSIASAAVSHDKECVNPFMLLDIIRHDLKKSALLSKEEDATQYISLLGPVEGEFEEIIKDEVQRAISSDEGELQELCNKYISNVRAYRKKERVRDELTRRDVPPDERLMRSIEDKLGISEAQKDDFRGEILSYIGSLAIDNKKFDYRSNEQLHKALAMKLFEDKKDSINFQKVFTGVVDEETQEKIDLVKTRLKKDFGYCEICATDVLNYTASIFARGDVKK